MSEKIHFSVVPVHCLQCLLFTSSIVASKMSLRLGASTAVRELRLHLCQTSSASAGARAFVSAHYDGLKTANPKLPLLVRECSGSPPRLWARFPYGQEQSQDLTNKSADQILQMVKDLAK